MVFSYSAWDRCVDLARTSEEERARLWDLCSPSEVDKEVIRCEAYSKSSACIFIKNCNSRLLIYLSCYIFLELDSEFGVILCVRVYQCSNYFHIFFFNRTRNS